MKLVNIKDINIPEVPNNIPEYAERKVPKNMPRLHYLGAVIGSRNSGKTTAVLRMLKMYIKTKTYDKIFWWSPTARRELKMKSFIEEVEDKVKFELFDKFNEAEFVEIQEWIRGEIDEYRQYKKRLEAWKRFKKCRSVDDLSHDDLILLEEIGYEKPKTEYKNGFPSYCMVFDDMIGSKSVFSPNCRGTTSNFWILHRHLSCSVLILSQIVSNGIPRQIRGNMSLWILFSCKSDKLKKDVADELAFKCDPETFLAVWEFATKDPHDFLLADYDCPTAENMFRKNWNKLIVYSPADTEEFSNT